MNSRSFVSVASVLFTSAFVACSAAPAPVDGESTDDAVIGGVDARSPSLDAIGALVLAVPDSAVPEPAEAGPVVAPDGSPPPEDGGATPTRVRGDGWIDPLAAKLGKGMKIAGSDGFTYYPFCTATLIGPRTVLTAEHCAQVRDEYPGYTIAFAMGYEAAKPREVVTVSRFVNETTITGGGLGLGADVSLALLEKAITSVKPLAIAALAAKDVGKEAVVVGYGVQDAKGTAGTRKAGGLTIAGLKGNAMELAYGSFEAYSAATGGDRASYDASQLLEGYEVYLKSGAQPCRGDSGGPILMKSGSTSKIVGVGSYVPAIDGNLCKNGAVYAAMGPAVQELVKLALTCDSVGIEGKCKGSVATRCTAPNEGEWRVTNTDCGTLGQKCGIVDGRAACVDR